MRILLCFFFITVTACGRQPPTTRAAEPEGQFFLVKTYCFAPGASGGAEIPCVAETQDTGACGLVFTVGGPVAILHNEDGSGSPVENGFYQRDSNEGQCSYEIRNEDSYE